MNPVAVEVVRGGVVESRHRGAAAVVDDQGGIVWAMGEAEALVFPRSAVKPLQALPLAASGAADAFGLDDAEIAIACGSHGGTPEHVAVVESALAKAGCLASWLECGAHWPLDEAAARGLAARGERPTPLHNNCSGKHAAFLGLARHRGRNPSGYVRPDHPAMREVTAAMSAVMDHPLDAARFGIDGCSIPAFAVPLATLARGFARFGTGVGLSADLAAATRRIRAAIATEPLMLAGAGRFDSDVAACVEADVVTKVGAEGVACAAVPGLGLGMAVKAEDGAGRAAEVILAALLTRFLGLKDETAGLAGVLARRTRLVLRNWNGMEVGVVRAAPILD